MASDVDSERPVIAAIRFDILSVIGCSSGKIHAVLLLRTSALDALEKYPVVDLCSFFKKFRNCYDYNFLRYKLIGYFYKLCTLGLAIFLNASISELCKISL